MFGIGGQELILLMLIGLVVLGPERLPRIANQIGSWLGQARRMTRVMKRQLEEELDIGKQQIMNPPPSSRQPSFQPKKEPPAYTPRDDDEYSPQHDEGQAGSGVGDDETPSAEDVAASDAERDAVLEASETAADTDAEETSDKKEPS